MNPLGFFDLWFGSRADRVRSEYSRIEQLQAGNRILGGSREQVEQDLAGFEAAKDEERNACKREYKEMLAQQKELVGQQQEFQLRERRLADRLSSFTSRLGVQIRALFSPGQGQSVDHLQKQLRTLDKKIRRLDKKIAAQTQALNELRRRLKELGRSRESLEFAAARIRDAQTTATAELAQTDCRIDEFIRLIVRCSRLQILRAKQRRAAGYDAFFGKVYELRRVLRQLDCLNLTPPPVRPDQESEMKFGVVDIVRPTKNGFATDTIEVVGNVSMHGIGSAHKKVRRGNSSQWKRIDVSFSGKVTVGCEVETRHFHSEGVAAAAVAGAQESFAGGLAAGRKEYSFRLMEDLQRQAAELTAALRETLEAGLQPTAVDEAGQAETAPVEIGH